MNRFVSYIILAGAALLAVSCSKKEDEPMADEALTITEAYLPAGVAFDQDDSQFLKRCQKWNQTTITVNSANDLPDDPLGFSPSYSKIDFSRNTLILTYMLHRWTIDTSRNTYSYNYDRGTYDWLITLGSSFYDEEQSDVVYFTRFAIQVPKQTAGAVTRVTVNLYDASFSWD